MLTELLLQDPTVVVEIGAALFAFIYVARLAVTPLEQQAFGADSECESSNLRNVGMRIGTSWFEVGNPVPFSKRSLRRQQRVLR